MILLILYRKTGKNYWPHCSQNLSVCKQELEPQEGLNHWWLLAQSTAKFSSQSWCFTLDLCHEQYVFHGINYFIKTKLKNSQMYLISYYLLLFWSKCHLRLWECGEAYFLNESYLNRDALTSLLRYSHVLHFWSMVWTTQFKKGWTWWMHFSQPLAIYSTWFGHILMEWDVQRLE